MYSPSQVSAMLKIPPSTLRHYAVLFAEHITPQQPGKKRIYTDSDVLIFQRVKDLSRKMPFEQIGPRLRVVEEQPAPQPSALALIPEIAARFERLEADRQNTAKDVSELRARLERLEAWGRLPWWKRIFGQPPG